MIMLERFKDPANLLEKLLNEGDERVKSDN